MKRKLAFLFFMLAAGMVSAQMIYPAKWTFTAEMGKDNEATLFLKVKLDPDWHLYSQYTPDGGPLPTVFTFEPSDCYERIGKVIEPKPHEAFDSTFEVNVLQWDTEVLFKQKVRLKDKSCRITGTIEYQVCKESCIFKDTSFTFILKGNEVAPVKEESTSTPTEIEAVVPPLIQDTFPARPVADVSGKVPVTTDRNAELEPGCGTGRKKASIDQSLLGIFIAGMLGGLLALLTPCVFPMIPMTVSFFTKRSGSRKKAIGQALIYAISIIIIYVSLGLLVTVSFGSDALNDMSSNGFFNMAFFIIFVIFAISFFGAFEITLPSWMINKADQASDRGGLVGIFFMAFTLSLVSFSCTGPIIGTLLVEAAQGRSYLGPLAGMTGFSAALAIPFALFALFPNWLNSLPRSGSWLNTVKVSLGFIELALAFKFLSNVDLAYHWGFLKREIFIAIWVVIALMLGFYLLGKLRLSHDSEEKHISTGRLLCSFLVFTFALYLIPGIWGAPLKLISGFPPPDFYKEWKTGSTHDCPHDLNCFHDYEEGMRYAKAQNKPVMLDFTGWSCVNCRKMEDNVWSDPKVLKRLAEDYVLISLYVDDKTPLPAEQQVISPTSGKKIKTVGNKWSDLQASVYNTNSQPYYVLIDNQARLLAHPSEYNPDIDQYVAFLDEGLCRFKLRSKN